MLDKPKGLSWFTMIYHDFPYLSGLWDFLWGDVFFQMWQWLQSLIEVYIKNSNSLKFEDCAWNHDDQHWCNQVTSQTQVYCWGGRTGKNSMDFPLSMVKAPETWRQHQNLAILGFKNMANFDRLGMDSNGFPETPKTVYGRLSWVHLTLFLSEAPVLVASPQGLPTFQWCLNGSLGLLGGLHLGEPQSAEKRGINMH